MDRFPPKHSQVNCRYIQSYEPYFLREIISVITKYVYLIESGSVRDPVLPPMRVQISKL